MTNISTEEYNRAIKELDGKRIPVDCDAASLFCVVSALQLSLRHPEFKKISTAKIVARFIEGAKEKLDPTGGAIRQLLDMGDNPDLDVIATIGTEEEAQNTPLPMELIDILESQHNAIDRLMAQLISRTNLDFIPTESPIWPAITAGAEILKKYGRLK